MDIRQIKFFCDVVHTGSVNRAAQLNYVSASSISRSMRSLEHKANSQLFKRSHTGMVLTSQGEEFYAMVEPILNDFHSIENMFFSQSPKDELLRLTICVHHNSISQQAMLNFYAQYAGEKEYADIVVAEYLSLREVLHNMQSKYYMLGTVQYGSNHREKVHRLIEENALDILHENSRKIYASVREGHPLSSHDILDVESLRPYPRVAYVDEKLSDINYCADLYSFDTTNVKKRILIHDRAQIDETLKYTDAYYIGTGDTGINLLKNSGVVCVPLNTDQRILTSVICRSNCILTENAKRFIDILISLFNETE